MKKQTLLFVTLITLFSSNKSGDLIEHVASKELSITKPQNTHYLVVKEKLTIFSKMKGHYVPNYSRL